MDTDTYVGILDELFAFQITLKTFLKNTNPNNVSLSMANQ